MFKCSECGCEFEQKPDFCNCGNNIFTEIEIEKPKSKEKTYKEQYLKSENYIRYFDPVSVSIFVLCLILSAVSVFIIKPYEKVEKETKVIAKKIIHDVPDINTFWNDTPPKSTEELKENKDMSAEVENIIIQPTVANNSVQKQQQKPQQKNTVSKPAAKTQPPKITNNATNKPSAQNAAKSSVTPKSSQSQNTQSKNQASTNTQTASSQATVWQPSQQNQQPSPQPVISKSNFQATVLNQGNQDLTSYKEGLRNTIGKKIDFTKVYGSGSCVVDFKVDSSGRLIERKFSTQSSNNTLNDEVFKAVKSVSVYKTPPTSYNGQVMHLSVKFSNGYYSVSLK